MTLERLPKILLRYLWFLVLVVSSTSLIAYYILAKQPVTYKVTTQLLIGPSLDSPSPDLNSLKIGGQLILTYAELAGTRSFLEAVNNKLDEKIDLDELDSLISVKQNIETRILTIVAYNEDPKLALAIASAAADVFVEISPSKDNTVALLRDRMGSQTQQLEQIVEEANLNVRKLESELANLKAINSQDPDVLKFNIEQQNIVLKQLTDERSRLSDALRTLATLYDILSDTNTNQVAIIEPAKEYVPLSQNVSARVATAGASGLFVALAIVFLVEMLGDKIRFPEDYYKVTGSPILGVIKRHPSEVSIGEAVSLATMVSETSNNYDEVAAKLIFYAKETSSNTFLLSSTGLPTGDDASVVASNLAVACAKVGSKVILIDAQIENPRLTEIFTVGNLNELKEHSVNNVKIKKVSDAAPGVDFVPIGMLPDADNLIGSKKFTSLVEGLKKEVDLVLIVASPLPWSSKGLSLASLIGARVILVTRPAETRVKVAAKLVDDLREMKIPVAGIVFDLNVLTNADKIFRAPIFRKLLGRGNPLPNRVAP